MPPTGIDLNEHRQTRAEVIAEALRRNDEIRRAYSAGVEAGRYTMPLTLEEFRATKKAGKFSSFLRRLAAAFQR